MRVFILSTGRCGSTTFAKACAHFTNYTSGHETRTGRLGKARLAYPDHHIESDNRLSWFLGRLDEEFGKDAFYVHLIRDGEAVAASLAKRTSFKGAIMTAYSNGLLLHSGQQSPDATMIDFAHDYVETVNANISAFLKDKSKQMQMDIKDAQSKFPEFCTAIDANGNLEAALAEFDTHHNASN